LAWWAIDTSGENVPGLGRIATREVYEMLSLLMGDPPAWFWRVILPDGPHGERDTCLDIGAFTAASPVDAGLAVAEVVAVRMIEKIDGFNPLI
jgi:hypothetical protein